MLQQLIEDILKGTKERCEFKKAFIPRGFTCVNIKKCARDITIAVEKRLWNKKHRETK